MASPNFSLFIHLLFRYILNSDHVLETDQNIVGVLYVEVKKTALYVFAIPRTVSYQPQQW